MTNTTFSDEVQIIKENIYNTEINDLEINGLLWNFLLVSSSLSTFLPELKTSEHYKIVQNMQFHRSVSAMDLLYPSLLENTTFHDKDGIIEKSHTKGHIFVGYHAGAYNMILRCLAEKNVPFCVVANNEYINDFEAIVQRLYKDLPHEDDSEKLQIFSSEDPKLLLKLTKNISEGTSVFIFIDGNSGTQKNNFGNDKNLLKIDFLNHHIYARQGVAFLSYLSKAPIVTVTAKRDEDMNNTVTLNLLDTDAIMAKSDNRNDYINAITQKIYKELETYLVKNYEQWSGWFYIHKFFDTEELLETETIDAKAIQYENTPLKLSDYIHLIKHNDDHIFLVMKQKYEIMRIGDFLYDVLNFFGTPKTISPNESFLLPDGQEVGFEFLEELVEMNFLKPVV